MIGFVPGKKHLAIEVDQLVGDSVACSEQERFETEPVWLDGCDSAA
jgi:hypothetical protein